MTMTASELQSYVDSGRVPSTSGTSQISTSITIDGSRRVIFEANSFVWTGSASRSLFEYDAAVVNSKPVMFRDVEATSEIEGSSIFRTVDDYAQPHFLVFESCSFSATGAYCIDLNRLGYTITPAFRNMVTSGSGALRLRAATDGVDPGHATSQLVIDGWTHTGSNRVGPSWNLFGASGLVMDACIDNGNMELNAALVSGGWTGPLAILINSPRTPNVIRNLVIDWDDINDDNALGCYIGEIRTDNGAGTGQHEYVELFNPTLTHQAIDAAVKPWRIMGSDTNTAHSLVARIVCAESPSVSHFLIGGRGALWIDKPFYKPGEESTGYALKTLVDGIFVGGSAFQDVIETSTTKLPSNDSSSATTYSGSANETNYSVAPQQHEELLEG